VSAWEQDLYRMGVPPEMTVYFETTAGALAHLDAYRALPDPGMLLTGDTVQVRPDKGLTFMHSYPNLIPLDALSVQRIAQALEPLAYDAIYGGWWERVIPSGAKHVMARSVEQYINAVTPVEEAY
ncbi:MAG TPA: hypothetical protein PLD10_24480, partial [Rhodopila sp.]|nr:hypothetical protein [Rhodopila sp.]